MLVGTNTSGIYTITTGGEMPFITPESESPMTYREVDHAMKGMSMKKSPGSYDIMHGYQQSKRENIT